MCTQRTHNSSIYWHIYFVQPVYGAINYDLKEYDILIDVSVEVFLCRVACPA